MKYLLSICFFFLISYSQAQDTARIYLNDDFEKTNLRKAAYHQDIVEIEDGYYYGEIYGFNDILIEKGYYKIHKKSRIKHGDFMVYNMNGSLIEKGAFSNDLKVGYWTVFDFNGDKDWYGKYNPEGKKDSLWIQYHREGTVSQIGNYINGNKEGEWLGFNKDGDKSFIMNFNTNGEEHGAYISFSSEGLPEDRGSYSIGEKNGEWNYFFDSGERSGTVDYQSGLVVKSTYWNEDGSTVTDTNQVVNQEPTFPGGEREMYVFLSKNVKYPKKAINNNIQGRVYVSFVVEKNGEITDVKLARGQHPLIDQEAMRVVREMPIWSPGISHNRIRRIRYNLPVVFQLR